MHLPPRGDTWPTSLPLLDHVRTVPLDVNVTIVVGENGSGKSTLLETLAIAAGLPVAGSWDVAGADPTLARVGDLASSVRLEWTHRSTRGLFMRAEDFFGYVHTQNRKDEELRADAARLAREYAHLPELELRRIQGPFLGPVAGRESRYRGDLDGRSHGEAFLAFFGARVHDRGLYVLDEPEAALSPSRQLAFLSLVRERARAGAQFVIATHAPIVMALPEARVLELREDGLVESAFDDLDHVQLLRNFLAAPEAFLRHL